VKKLILILALCGSAWGQMAAVSEFADTQDKSAGTSISTGINATVEVGNLAVCVVASDNIGTSGADNNDHTTVEDTFGGNTWTQAREFTNAAAAGAGATVSVWWSVVATQLTLGGGTLTANFSGSPSASNIVCWEFTKGTGTVTLATGGQDEQVDGGDAGSMTISGLTSREYLFVRGIAVEADRPGFSANTASYTAIIGIGTTGGGGASNMQALGEFIIATATGHTSDPTVGASADNASVFVALWVNDGAAPPTPTPRRRIYVSPGSN
jgi:hypothetical protein